MLKTFQQKSQLNNFKKFLNKSIIEKLSEYCQSSIQEILKGSDGFVFGGAVRDCIANQPIHDVDILCFSRSYNIIAQNLIHCGFERVRTTSEFAAMYNAHRGIFKPPITFAKYDKSQKQRRYVQLISPSLWYLFESYNKSREEISDEEVFQKLLHFAANVDLSCCGGIFGSFHNIIEVVDGAYSDCENHTFRVMRDAILHHQDRINLRIKKLIDRGWKRIGLIERKFSEDIF